jgi:hypothetical protein
MARRNRLVTTVRGGVIDAWALGAAAAADELEARNMTTRTEPHTISLSAELARTDNDLRHQSAKRLHAAIHRVCVLRATANGTSYETEWARIFDQDALLADAQRSKLVSVAALDVLEIQHEHSLTVCRMDGIAYDERVAQEYREVLAALRIKVEHDLP